MAERVMWQYEFNQNCTHHNDEFFAYYEEWLIEKKETLFASLERKVEWPIEPLLPLHRSKKGLFVFEETGMTESGFIINMKDIPITRIYLSTNIYIRFSSNIESILNNTPFLQYPDCVSIYRDKWAVD